MLKVKDVGDLALVEVELIALELEVEDGTETGMEGGLAKGGRTAEILRAPEARGGMYRSCAVTFLVEFVLPIAEVGGGSFPLQQRASRLPRNPTTRSELQLPTRIFFYHHNHSSPPPPSPPP